MKIKILPIGTIQTNCYVVSDDNGTCAIIDCDGNPRPLFDYIEENKLNPTHILLTHGHDDHIGAVEMVKEKYGCTLVAAKAEATLLADPCLNLSAMMSGSVALYPDVLLEDGDDVKVGDLEFSAMLTPGHTAGSLCYIIKDQIFSGDTLFQSSCGRTDLPTGDWGTIMKSLARLRDLSGDYTVYPGHGPYTSLEVERRSNPYM